MVKSSKTRRGNSIRENAITGFGIGLGFGFSNIIFIILGIFFFIPGFLMLKSEKKKSENEQDKTKIYIAFGFMIIGCILCFGMGLSFILSEMGNTDF